MKVDRKKVVDRAFAVQYQISLRLIYHRKPPAKGKAIFLHCLDFKFVLSAICITVAVA